MYFMEKVQRQRAEMQKKRKRGFTLVELIVVIAILAILMALLVPMVSKYIQQATDTTGNANAKAVYTAGAALGAELVASGTEIKDKYTTEDKMLRDYLGDKMKGTGTVKLNSDGAVIEATWTNGGKTYTYPD